jgi:ribosomal protein S18 acetylase RimI-like enzyme
MEQATLRTARPADVDQVVRAYTWLFEPPGSCPPKWDPERGAAAVRRAITSDSAAVLIATMADELVGFCTAYEHIDSVRFGRGVWVEDLAVHPAHRSQGVGRRLLDEAKRWAETRDATHLQLVSSQDRVDAHRFYERAEPDWRSINFGWGLAS